MWREANKYGELKMNRTKTEYRWVDGKDKSVKMMMKGTMLR